MRVPPIAEEHRRRNESTRDRWTTMALHRDRVMQLLRETRGDGAQSLCVLGAGNANDIDLNSLAREFQRIDLVDLDDQALARGAGKLTEAARQQTTIYGGIDLTGILPILTGWQTSSPPDSAEVANAMETARSAQVPAFGTFDVVASACVLTQLIDSVCLSLAASHPSFTELILAVRNRHLEIMVELLNPGGSGVLITDFVSTETAPELADLADEQIPAAAVHWINNRNFFTGANPYAIRDYLVGLKNTAHTVENVQVSPAWRWDIGAKQLAVSAITFQRIA